MAKFRTGFVTNSSSSSFVVAFKDIPTTVEEMKALLFDPNQEVMRSPWGDESLTCDDVAQQVLDDLQSQVPNDDKKIAEALGGWLDNAPKYEDFLTDDMKPGSKEYNEAFHNFEDARKAFEKAKIKQFKKANRGADIYVFSYADENGRREAILEHGDTFDHLPHIRISHH